MVDSAVLKKPSKEFTLIKTVSQLEKNASNDGTASTVRRRKRIYPHISEGTVRGFKKCYEAQIKDEICKKQSLKTVIVNKLQGRPCLLGNKTYPFVQKYL